MITEPGDEIAAGGGGGGHLPECHADREHREQAIRTLKAALVQGRLAEDEYDERMAQASASRSRAELAALTADLPDGLTAVPPTARDVRIGIGMIIANCVRAGVCVIIAAASVAAAILLWRPDNALAFMIFFAAAVTLLVAPIVTVGLVFDVRHQKRSGEQP